MGLSVHLQRAAVFVVAASVCIQMLNLSEVCDEREKRSGELEKEETHRMSLSDK